MLFLFLLWVTRMSLRDLRGSATPGLETGYHEVLHGEDAKTDAWLIVEEGGGLTKGERYDLFGGVSLGRSPDADIRIDDRYASGIHVRVFSKSGAHYVEDMSSTNGTLLNSSDLHGEAELRPGDKIRIGDTEFTFEVS
ncbi:FHA domain-containing protein [soil metagenome]